MEEVLKKGVFITFEGIDGSGKSTQVELLLKFLKTNNKMASSYKEPGGTRFGEEIRNILLFSPFDIPPWSEVFLFLASRKVLVDRVVLPELQKGYFVILDRFFDSTYAYQGYGNGIDISYLKDIHRYAGIDVKPHITFLLDISPKDALLRMEKRDISPTRIEKFPMQFFERVREGYIALSKEEPDRIKLIDATKSPKDIHKEIIENLEKNGFI